MELLKLLALDDDDLKIVSAHLQDAVLRSEEMAYLSKDQRFAVLLNRFNWLSADETRRSNGEGFERRRAALRFEKVRRVQLKQLAPKDRSETLELLAVSFEPGDAPAGFITLDFAGGSAVRLHVDCIEAELRDLGPTWKTPNKPAHPEDPTETTPTR